MPRGHLNEKHVQREAVQWLTAYYQQRTDVQASVAEIEVVIRSTSKLGSGRADGLVVSQLQNGTIYTAAVEAKSIRTMSNIRQRYRNEPWVGHALLAGGVSLVLVGVVCWFVGTGLWLWVLPLIAFLGGGAAYLFLMSEHRLYRTIDVIKQVKRYPAHEQWIALSTDAYNRLARVVQTAFREECRREGIGLLHVRSRQQSAVVELPRPHPVPKGQADFLACYVRGDQIRQTLQDKVETFAQAPSSIPHL